MVLNMPLLHPKFQAALEKYGSTLMNPKLELLPTFLLKLYKAEKELHELGFAANLTKVDPAEDESSLGVVFKSQYQPVEGKLHLNYVGRGEWPTKDVGDIAAGVLREQGLEVEWSGSANQPLKVILS
jgi:hypothetical protein